ncbi:MAG: leucyl aminopeptidase [Patescibacteria group bacterium]|jgi:leucyl aminopeptidase
MQFILSPEPLGSYACDLVVEGFWQGDKTAPGKDFLPDDLTNLLSAELKRRGFEAKEGEIHVLSLLGHSKVKYIMALGLGQKNKLTQDRVRSLAAKALKNMSGVHASKVVIHQSIISAMKDKVVGVQALVEGMELAAYSFDAYRKKDQRLKKKEVLLDLQDKTLRKKIESAIELGKIYASATCLARDLVNTPSMHMHPAEMVERAKALSGRGKGITCKVFNREQMAKLGMEASISVGQGSQYDPVMVQLVYKPKVRTKKKIALVGKAITFDSGGLSLKLGDNMKDMKSDMAGAASVLGVFQALPSIRPKAEVHGIFIAAENMPSGTAYRPGDVVSAMDGTTIEIENTDAEGRVTLADSLAYAALKIKPDTIIDLATLTGAVVIALGSDVAGLFSNDKNLKLAIQRSAQEAGEPIWELPLYPAYNDLIKSKIADIRNVGGRPAGIITAALFLQKFVHDIPWVHIDIGGPSYAEKETVPEWPVGGTGWGVRTLLNYLKAAA